MRNQAEAWLQVRARGLDGNFALVAVNRSAGISLSQTILSKGDILAG